MKKLGAFEDILEEICNDTGIPDVHRDLRKKYHAPGYEYIHDLQKSIEQIDHVFSRYFDEVYYLITYRDVLDHLYSGNINSGLQHFLGWGIHEGRAPLRPGAARKLAETLQESVLTRADTSRANPISEIQSVAPFLSLELLENIYLTGHELNVPQDTPVSTHGSLNPNLSRLFDEFDRAFYEKQVERKFRHKSAAFNHYMTNCKSQLTNPNAEFDELFYLAFYYDVRAAVNAGELNCGFEHFVIAGRNEGRLAKYDKAGTLEAIMPGVTKPTAIDFVEELERKIEPCAFSIDTSRQPTVWIMVPFLHTDLMFGGFASFIEFVESLLRHSVRIGIFIKDAPKDTISYFRYRSPDRLLAMEMDNIEVFSPIDSVHPFVFSERDVFICYSNWDGLWGSKFALETNLGVPVYWIQEHEAIFFSNNSMRFLMDSVYYTDHIGIFNSRFLRKYFQRQKIGLYRDPNFLRSRSMSYEHVFQYLQPSKKPSRSASKKLLLYARPEAHAERNLFEIAVLALRRALRSGAFAGQWEFWGIGSLGGPYSIALSSDRELRIVPKMSLEEYRDFIQGVDVGVSLMYAPHPSLLPYEFSIAGAVVVTNNFEERDETYFDAFGGNIISFDPSVAACADAIVKAANRVQAADYEKVYPAFNETTWQDVFSIQFFARLKEIGLDFTQFK